MLTITRSDRFAILILLVQLVVLLLGAVTLIAAAEFNLSDHALAVTIVVVAGAMFVVQERLMLLVMIWRGYLCRECRGASVYRDVDAVVRGQTCRCKASRDLPVMGGE